MSGKRTYSDEEKAAALLALDANGGNVAKTAREARVPRKTLEEWEKGRIHPAVANIRQHEREPLADRLEAMAHDLVDVMPDKLAEASLQQIALTLGIAVDKMRLLREQATAIQKNERLTDEERADRVAELLDRARARRTGQPPSSATLN